MYQQAIRATAWQLIKSDTTFEDSDSKASLLTRDGEMSLNVIPYTGSQNNKILLGGHSISGLEDSEILEELNMNSIPVPASWRRIMPQEEDGMIWLPMQKLSEQKWIYQNGRDMLVYSFQNGLERKKL